MPSGRQWRGWHTDWPHDLSSYGQGARHAGAIAQPFPPVCLCLTMVWYLSDTDSESGGTWVVPGSHVDLRNPRGPADGINVHAPIPGDMQVPSPYNMYARFVCTIIMYVCLCHMYNMLCTEQVAAPAGSVFIQDTRCWHCQGKAPSTISQGDGVKSPCRLS